MILVKEGAPARLRALVICLARTQICSSIVPQYQKCMYGNSLGICRLLPFVQPLLTPNPCEFSFLASSSRAYKPALDKYNLVIALHDAAYLAGLAGGETCGV